MKSLKKNFLYNIVYQIFIFIIPLISVPYVSRVIGTEGVGLYSYSYSIMYYFMIFSMLGLNNYGNRSIAKIRDNKIILSKVFKEIHLMQIITTSIMLIMYGLFIFFFVNDNITIYLLQAITLLSCMFDINWFYFGLEEFKMTIFRNTFIKIVTLVLIFFFVKTENDVFIYTLILSSNILLSQLILWPFINKYIDRKIKIKLYDIKKHFIPCLKLFLPVIAVTIYKVMDKTMIGYLSNVQEVGLYEQAEKIINVPNAIIAALGTVMLPRMSNLYANGKDEAVEPIINKSMVFMMFLAFAMTFGLSSIAKDFSIIFLGNDFEKSGILIIYLSVTIIFLSWGNVIRTQYLIPKEKDKEYIISAFIGAFINLLLNLFLIPKFKSIGACIGTIFAELFVVAYQTFAVRNVLPIGKYIKEVIPFLFKSIVMYIMLIGISFLNFKSLFIKIIVMILSGIVIYSFLNINYITNILKIKIFRKLKQHSDY